MRRGSRAFVLLASLLVAGCGPRSADEPAPASGAGQEAGVQGVVRVVGSGPVDVHVMLETPDGSSVRVVGELRDEIRRLSGAVVRVEGAVEASEVPIARRQLRAADYEIVSVNGEPVIQGVVEGKMGGWTVVRTRDGERVYLASAPDEIRTGQKVWVQGPRAVVVQSYGVIGN